MQPCPHQGQGDHRWVLEATHILEEKIEWLGRLATRMRSTSCWCFHSCGHLRWSRACLRGHTKTSTGEDHAKAPPAISHQEDQRGRCLQSPSPTLLRRWVTFQDQKGKSSSKEDSLGKCMGQVSGRGEPAECDFGPLPILEPKLESFLEGQCPHPDKEGTLHGKL